MEMMTTTTTLETLERIISVSFFVSSSVVNKL